MDETQITKFYWRVEQGSEVWSESGCYVASCGVPTAENANLIASAPDLYRALQKLSGWCAENLTHAQFIEAYEIGSEAEFALRKAKGEL